MDINLEDATNYHYNKFPPRNLDLGRLLQPIVEATDALARYDQMIKKMHNSEIFLTPLRRQEAVISSRMEGTVSTIDEILEYEADHEEDAENDASVRSEVIETILYQRALKATQKALEDGYPISQSLIKSIHQRLLSYGRGASKSPGEFKNEQNYIAGRLRKILFVPISPEKLQDGLDNLFEYLEKSDDIQLIKICIAHVEFEALHPFKDGNGRIGRMLITLMLWHSKIISEPHFYVSGYLEENKDLYIDIMRNVSQNDDWEGWCIFFLEAIKQQAIANLAIAENISQLYEEMKVVFSDVLSSPKSINALDFVFTHPTFRNSKFTNESGIPSATAARFSKALLAKNLIVEKEKASGRKSSLYSFEPLIELVRV